MQESRFEREVKEQLDELRLNPSAQVWQRLEAGLREKKRRRVLILFSLLAGLILLGTAGLYWSMTSTPGSGQTAIRAVNDDPSMRAAPDAFSAESAGRAPVSEQRNGQPDKTDPKKEMNSVDASHVPDSLSRSRSVPSVRGVRGVPSVHGDRSIAPGEGDQQAGNIETQKNVVAARPGPVVRKRSTDQQPALNPQRQPLEKPSRSQPKETLNASGETGITPDRDAASSSFKSDTASVSLPDSTPSADQLTRQQPKDALAVSHGTDSTINKSTPDSAAAVIVKQFRKRRVRFGIDVANGMSDLVKTPAILPVAQDMPAQQFAGNSIFFPAAAPVYYPGEMRGGFAFQVGGSVVYDPVPHLRLSSGLTYAYYSNEVNSGRIIDDSLRQQAVNYSTTLDSREGPWVVNRFHYAQVPIRAGLLIAPRSASPLEVNLGVNLQYLFSTTALQFRHQYADAYYLNKEEVNRFAMSVAGGINWNLSARKAFNWSVGPEFSIALKPWTRQTEDVRDRLFYLGLRGRIFLPTGK